MDPHVYNRIRRCLAGVMIFTACLFALACTDPPQPAPVEILGRWMTDAESHQDRTFEIREDAVIFGTGKFSAPRLHVLVRVEPKPDAVGWKACTLFYREYDGSIAELDLEYHSKPSARIRFPNRRESWFRSEDLEDKGSEDA